MTVFDPGSESLRTAHRFGKTMQHSVKIGAAAGAGYGVAKSGYYKVRQKFAKTRKEKRAHGKKALDAFGDIPSYAGKGTVLGYAAKFATGPAALAYIKGQNVYHMAAHKAGRFQRRAKVASTPGFDARGFPIKARKAPSPKVKRVISGLLKATNEDKMDKAKLKGIAVKAGTDTVSSKKLFTSRNSREAMLASVARKLATGDSNASQDVVAKAQKTTNKALSRPLVTSAEARDQVAAVIKKTVRKIKQTNFRGQGRSLGVKEATIDYVITKVKAGRSRGPAWIDQRQREVLIEAILEEYRQLAVRSREKIRGGLPLKRKVGNTSMVVSKSAGMYAAERGKKLAFSLPHGLAHKQLGKNLQQAAARRHALSSNRKRKFPK